MFSSIVTWCPQGTVTGAAGERSFDTMKLDQSISVCGWRLQQVPGRAASKLPGDACPDVDRPALPICSRADAPVAPWSPHVPSKDLSMAAAMTKRTPATQSNEAIVIILKIADVLARSPLYRPELQKKARAKM